MSDETRAQYWDEEAQTWNTGVRKGAEKHADDPAEGAPSEPAGADAATDPPAEPDDGKRAAPEEPGSEPPVEEPADAPPAASGAGPSDAPPAASGAEPSDAPPAASEAEPDAVEPPAPIPTAVEPPAPIPTAVEPPAPIPTAVEPSPGPPATPPAIPPTKPPAEPPPPGPVPVHEAITQWPSTPAQPMRTPTELELPHAAPGPPPPPGPPPASAVPAQQRPAAPSPFEALYRTEGPPQAAEPVYEPYYTGYEPPPGPPSGGPGVRFVVVAAVAALVVGAAAAAGWLLLRGGDGEPQGSPSHSPSASASQQHGGDGGGSASPSPTATSSTRPAAPAGFRTVSESGFSLAVPESWSRRVQHGQGGQPIYFFEASASRTRFIQVFEVTEPGITPYEAALSTEQTKKDGGSYHRNSLTDHDDSADLDYSYTGSSGPQRVVYHPLRAGDGRMYALVAVGPADGWPEQRQLMDKLVSTFCAGSDCPD